MSGLPPTSRGVRQRDAIVNATVGALRKHGYRGTSLQRIAEEADTSKRLVLHYFGSRDDLFDEVVQHVGRHVLDQVERAMSAQSDPAAALSDGLDVLWREIQVDPGLHIVFFGLLSESISCPAHRSSIAAVRSECRALIAEALVEAGCDCSRAGGAESVATLVLAGIAGLTIDFLERGNTPALESAFAQFKLKITALVREQSRYPKEQRRVAIA